MSLKVVVIAGCFALAACAGSTDDAPGPPAASTPTTATGTPAPDDADPTLTAKPPAGSRSVTGVIEDGVEARCLVLTVSGGTAYVLTGAVGELRSGDRVTVTGRVDAEAATTCQQGPVFVVATSTSA